MSREVLGFEPGSMKEDPRTPYRTPGAGRPGARAIPARRLRQPPMTRMSCV